MLKKIAFILVLTISFFVLKNGQAQAVTLFSDTISTSRPSAASPLSANNNATALLSIVNNGSRYLASDSAKIMKTSTGADVLTGLVVASQSAALTTVYFTTTVSSGVNGADVLIANQTAMHTVSFTIGSPIESGGKIILTFPGAGSTAASPSASTFSFNGLTTANAAANISYRLVSGGAVTCTSITVAAPSITCTTTGGGLIAGQTITFLIGCLDNNQNETSCTTQSPRLINPTKTANAGTGDSWTLSLKTQDASSADQETGTTKIVTVETVRVQATVDATFSFTIAGISNAVAANTGNTTGCTNTELTSSGIDASAVLINLGSLPVSSSVAPNISAQLITLTSNGIGGYSLTATSSGHLQDNSIGFAIADAVAPAVFPAATPWYGIHACGLDVNTATWGAASTTTTRGGTAKYGWPTSTTSVSLASDSTGPITGTGGNGITTVEYAAAVDATVPSGSYTTTITYVATPVF